MTPRHDWLLVAWEALPPRVIETLQRVDTDGSLASLDRQDGLSRERVRQLFAAGANEFLSAMRLHDPKLPERLGTLLADEPAVSESRVARVVPTGAAVARHTLVRSLGVSNPRTWAGDLRGWWSLDRGALERVLRGMTADGPLTVVEARAAAGELGFDRDFPLERLLGGHASPVLLHASGWVSKRRPIRDPAELWLRNEGAPRTVDEIARAVGDVRGQAVLNAMRKNDVFAQVRRAGPWTLAGP